MIQEVFSVEKYTQFGIRNCVKGYCPDEVFSAEEWLPAFGYVKDGAIVGTMFEATTIMPSPYWVYFSDHLNTQERQDDWVVHTLKNVDNINEAVGRIKAALGTPDYRLKVFPSLFDPNQGTNGGRYRNWGSLDGVTMNIDDPDHAFAMLKYLIDAYEQAFAERQYEHVELTGFYWFHESLGDRMPWYRRVTDYIRSLGRISMVSPYYKSGRHDRCYEAGFDLVSMQSNYFPLSPIGHLSNGPIERLDNNMQYIKTLGYGLEPEFWDVRQERVTGYKETLKRGVQYGIMQTYHLHFWHKPIVEACQSDEPYLRSVYDDLYKYIHCELNPDEMWIKPVEIPQRTMDVQMLQVSGDLPATAQEWLPIIAYRKDGAITDAMVRRLAVSPDPSAWYSEEFSTKAGWDAWTDRVFKSLEALNEAAGLVKEALDEPKCTVDVMFALPSCYNPDGDPHFYDNWGDGLNPNDPDDRFAMVKHLIDLYPTRLRGGQYPHLNFFGFRWIEPFVREEDMEWYLRTTDYIRTKNCYSLIEPDNGKENGCYRAGFELVALRFDEYNLDNATTAKFKAMGVQRFLNTAAELEAARVITEQLSVTNELQTYNFENGTFPAEGSDLYEALHTHLIRKK